MPAFDPEDFADHMDAFGVDFTYRGQAFKADPSFPPGESFATRGHSPSILYFAADAPDLENGDRIFRTGTDDSYVVSDLSPNGEALGRPTNRAKLIQEQ